MLIMAGVLGQLFRSQKKAMYRDPTTLELETAKEILAEVFRVRLSDVDEMIQNRFGEVHIQEVCSEEDGLWPQEFSLEGWGYFELIIFASILIRPSFSSSSRMESSSDSLCLVHRLRSFFFILPRVASSHRTQHPAFCSLRGGYFKPELAWANNKN